MGQPSSPLLGGLRDVVSSPHRLRMNFRAFTVEVERFEERSLFARCQIAPGAQCQSGDRERTDANATEPFDRNADRFHHAADDVIGPFVDDHRQDQALGSLAQDAELPRNDAMALDNDAVLDALQCHVGRSRQRQDLIVLIEFVPRMHHPVGNVAVVGQEEESLGITVEATDRIDPLRHVDELHDGPAVALVLRRGDVAARFVENDITRSLGPQEFAVDADLGANRIGFCAEFGYNIAVDSDAPLGDQGFGDPARGDSARGEYPL